MVRDKHAGAMTRNCLSGTAHTEHFGLINAVNPEVSYISWSVPNLIWQLWDISLAYLNEVLWQIWGMYFEISVQVGKNKQPGNVLIFNHCIYLNMTWLCMSDILMFEKNIYESL
jgi:hypothetical protein